KYFQVAVFDAVVHHFDEVTTSVFADVRHAWAELGLSCDGFERCFEDLPRLGASTGHQTRATTRPRLTPGDAHANEENAVLAQVRFTPLGILVAGVTAVDDRVTARQVRTQPGNHGVYWSASGYEHDQTARGRNLGDHFLDLLGREDVGLVTRDEGFARCLTR